MAFDSNINPFFIWLKLLAERLTNKFLSNIEDFWLKIDGPNAPTLTNATERWRIFFFFLFPRLLWYWIAFGDEGIISEGRRSLTHRDVGQMPQNAGSRFFFISPGNVSSCKTRRANFISLQIYGLLIWNGLFRQYLGNKCRCWQHFCPTWRMLTIRKCLIAGDILLYVFYGTMEKKSRHNSPASRASSAINASLLNGLMVALLFRAFSICFRFISLLDNGNRWRAIILFAKQRCVATAFLNKKLTLFRVATVPMEHLFFGSGESFWGVISSNINYFFTSSSFK